MGVSIVLYLDYPVRIISAINLNTELEKDGFTIKGPTPTFIKHTRSDNVIIKGQTHTYFKHTGDDEEKFRIFISFRKHPVPLCLIVHRKEEPNEQPVATLFESGVYLKKSAILVRGKQIKFSAEVLSQQSHNIHNTVTTPGLSILSILNQAGTMKIITLNFMLSSTENRLLSRLTHSASPSSDTPDADFDNLTEPQKALLAALNARFNQGRPLQGINPCLFQCLSMVDGVPDVALHALMSLSGRNDAFREVASNRNYISTDPAIQAFLVDWYWAPNTLIAECSESFNMLCQSTFRQPGHDESSTVMLPRIGSTSSLPSDDESPTEESEYLYNICGETMTVHSVIGDGNCLPRAVAAALNAESAQTTPFTQEGIRTLLAQRFRNILDLISSAPAIRNFFGVTDDDSVSQRQQELRENLAHLMSLGSSEALDNIQDDGSNTAEPFSPDWLEPGLLAFLPFEGTTVNIHSPRSANEPLYLSTLYNRKMWVAFAPELINYLEQNGQLTPEPHSFIHLIHTGLGERGHYYYATPNIPETDAPGAAITSNPLPMEVEQPGNLPSGLNFISN